MRSLTFAVLAVLIAGPAQGKPDNVPNPNPLGVVIVEQPVKVSTAAGQGVSHLGRPLTEHIQLEATAAPIATAAILGASRISPTGGGSAFDLTSDQCLVVTELDITYINADTASFPSITLRLGLADAGLTQVISRRSFQVIPDADGSGTLSKTFPSGLVFRVHPSAEDGTRLGLETFTARVVSFAASGYVMDCF